MCLPSRRVRTSNGHVALNHAAECHLSEEPAPRGALTFSSSSKVSWQHSQNPLLFLGAAVAVERGLCSPSLRSRQPSAPLRGNGKDPPWQRRQVPCCLRRAVGRQRCVEPQLFDWGCFHP